MLSKDSDVLGTLKRYAEHYPYDLINTWVESPLLLQLPGSHISHILPVKADWHAVELMSFDGVAFLEAGQYVFFQHSIASGDIEDAERYTAPWRKMEYILKNERLARRDGRQIRVHGMGSLRGLWRMIRFAQKKRIRPLERVFTSLFRKRCRWFVTHYALQIALHQQIHILHVTVPHSNGQQWQR